MDVLVSYCAHTTANRFTLGALDANTLALRPIEVSFSLTDMVYEALKTTISQINIY